MRQSHMCRQRMASPFYSRMLIVNSSILAFPSSLSAFQHMGGQWPYSIIPVQINGCGRQYQHDHSHWNVLMATRSTATAQTVKTRNAKPGNVALLLMVA